MTTPAAPITAPTTTWKNNEIHFAAGNGNLTDELSIGNENEDEDDYFK